MKRRVGTLAAVVVLALVGQAALGAITLFGPSTGSGQGFGNDNHNLMTLQTGAPGDEWGAVVWDGSADAITNPRPGGDVDIQSNFTATITSQGVSNLGIDKDSFGLLLDINEPGGAGESITLHDFELLFANAVGAEQFRLTYSAPIGGTVLSGIGSGDFDYLFRVEFDSDKQATNFFTNTDWRVGMDITQANAISNSADGPETFTLIDADFVSVTIIPEPSAIVVWSLLGALGLSVGWRRRRRKAA